jgi:hypothetical protein
MNKDIVKFHSWDCFLELGKYQQGNRLSISLVSAVNKPEDDLYLGEPIATATVNLPDIALGPDEIIIKNYSENEGMLSALQKSGLVSETVREIQTGHVIANVVTKTDKLKEIEKSFNSPKMKR